jgi:hypothetical protein
MSTDYPILDPVDTIDVLEQTVYALRDLVKEINAGNIQTKEEIKNSYLFKNMKDALNNVKSTFNIKRIYVYEAKQWDKNVSDRFSSLYDTFMNVEEDLFEIKQSGAIEIPTVVQSTSDFLRRHILPAKSAMIANRPSTCARCGNLMG